MVARSAIGYYFVRRVASFSRHCADRATAQSNPLPTPMTPASTFAPATQSLRPAPPSAPQQEVPIGGTMFASNFLARPPRVTHAKPPSTTVGQNTLEAYPRSYQASAELIQAENPVKEAPPYYSYNAAHNV
ncbi:hypothetical protein FRC08_010492 [Ceratobasidium sp. 394]|nr:hypothetical protein FRC08_010492 [Ceratobasidium sp. 394]